MDEMSSKKLWGQYTFRRVYGYNPPSTLHHPQAALDSGVSSFSKLAEWAWEKYPGRPRTSGEVVEWYTPKLFLRSPNKSVARLTASSLNIKLNNIYYHILLLYHNETF